jgi:threonine aldolase
MTAEACEIVCRNAHDAGVPVHMDGARIFNASVTLDSPVSDLTRHCDSVMFTLSKGLGAPVGSVLLGSKDFVAEARVWRKRLGGGMRQIGILAAAGLIALEDGPKRLNEDHSNAKKLAAGLADIPGVSIDPSSVETNIVIFDVSRTGRTASWLVDRLRASGVQAIAISETKIRMVTHLDVSVQDIDTTVKTFQNVCE